MSKNIIIFSDGTGQKGGAGTNPNTNVYKLFNMIEDRTEKQIAFYDPGLGTDWRKISGALFGRGFSKNLLECYRFIFDNYEADDKIYLFGFSRGAATVRSLSGFIELFGILPKSRPELIKKAFAIYKKDDPEKKAEAFIEKHHTMWTKVEFIGVWDTVKALGLPIKGLNTLVDRLFPHKFHSLSLSKGVNFARHALSIDDERKTFHPELWETIKKPDTKDRMKQVWFCGVHTDVGGGYPERDLSDITLKWMIKEAKEKKLIIYDKSETYQNLIASEPDINGEMHNEQKGFRGKLFRRETRSWGSYIENGKEKSRGEPCVHESVFHRTKNQDNTDTPAYHPWIKVFMGEVKPCIEK